MRNIFKVRVDVNPDKSYYLSNANNGTDWKTKRGALNKAMTHKRQGEVVIEEYELNRVSEIYYSEAKITIEHKREMESLVNKFRDIKITAAKKAFKMITGVDYEGAETILRFMKHREIDTGILTEGYLAHYDNTTEKIRSYNKKYSGEVTLNWKRYNEDVDFAVFVKNKIKS